MTLKKRSVFLFSLLIALLLVVTGCGTPKTEVGMNELTLEQLEKKLDNHETFLLLTFAEKDEYVKKTKFIEAWDDSFTRAGLTGFYVNLQDQDEKTIKELERKYKHPKSDEWDAVEDGLVLVENGGIQTDAGGAGKVRGLIEGRAHENQSFLEEDEIKRLDRGVSHALEYIQYYKIELTEY